MVRAAGGSEGGLVVQDPRVGPIEPLYALGAGVWLRVTEAGGSLEAVVQEARVPSRFLLAGVVGSTPLCSSCCLCGSGPVPVRRPGRVRPRRNPNGGGGWGGSGAGRGAGGARPAARAERAGGDRDGPGLVLLAVGTVVLAWGVPARPTLRWLPLVAAGGGLALLVSPLALPVLAVPVVAELLRGRYQEAWKDMAALGLAIWPLAAPAGMGGRAGPGRRAGRGGCSAGHRGEGRSPPR